MDKGFRKIKQDASNYDKIVIDVLNNQGGFIKHFDNLIFANLDL